MAPDHDGTAGAGASHGHLLCGPQPDVAGAAGYPDAPPRMGFFTDTSVCIGCKACEVACKEWNAVPENGLELTGMSYDNTQGLGADTWRHVAFIEQRKPFGGQEPGVSHDDVDIFAAAAGLGTGTHSPGPGATAPPPGAAPAGAAPAGEISPVSPDGRTELRWLMASTSTPGPSRRTAGGRGGQAAGPGGRLSGARSSDRRGAPAPPPPVLRAPRPRRAVRPRSGRPPAAAGCPRPWRRSRCAARPTPGCAGSRR